MSLNLDAMAAAERAKKARDSMRRRIMRLLGKHQVMRRLFLDEHGEVTPDAARFLSDMAREAGMGKRGQLSDEQLREARGAAHMVRYIIDVLALPEHKLRNLQHKLEALNNE